MAQPPAARTLRYQSVRSPQGIGTTKPSATARTTTGVWKILPERRPRCSTTPYSGKYRVPAKRNTRELNTRAGPERMSFVDMGLSFLRSFPPASDRAPTPPVYPTVGGVGSAPRELPIKPSTRSSQDYPCTHLGE